ncbi:hypothetical protein [Actinoplanes sp. NPDC051851]|uniref:hypothetical protein n=1 Tax=Actinoplanes sp. NPDC051851 TaxID=3154753 RepID=UPI0034260736
MRGSTIAAAAICTLMAMSGCANSDENAGSSATADVSASFAGLDEGTAAACTLASQATLGTDGRDLDVDTGKDLVALGRKSRSTIITGATTVLDGAVQKAVAGAGNPDEAVLVAEVSSAILKIQGVCQDTSSLKSSMTTGTEGTTVGSDSDGDPTK